MLGRYRLQIAACVVMFLLATVTTASAQNYLANPGFETGPTGGVPSSWLGFGNVYAERDNGGQFVAYEGQKLVSMYGNWSGPYNVSGVYQEFASTEGDQWSLGVKSRHWSGDPMLGDNFVVQKIVFKDGSDVEIGAVEAVVLNAASATDTWFDNTPVVGIAPAGTAQVEAMILFVQALDDGGAGHVDAAEFLYLGVVATDESTWGAIKSMYK
jgi:hypothetical protein